MAAEIHSALAGSLSCSGLTVVTMVTTLMVMIIMMMNVIIAGWLITWKNVNIP
jgi:hypothetical protein